jgi:N-acetyl-anhydromuramyl-L-alanine amidase AmpD
MRHPRTRTAAGLALSAVAALAAALLGPGAAASAQDTATQQPECPATLQCDFLPAAYQLNNPSDPQSYGNYDVADRPNTTKIKYIVLHDTETEYNATLRLFQNPTAYVSAHYVVRSSDGHVTQMVPTKDVAWQAGNWYINSQSIGIEQEGWATQGATYFTPALYQSTARLVKYLAAKYHVPLDRQHIIGHDNVPGTTTAGIAGMHWDPGPYWDWGYFFKLLGRPLTPTAGPDSKLVTIDPVFKENIQATRDCEQSVDLPPQASSFVYLHTAPSDDAPLFSDPGLHTKGGPGTNCAADWGDKASAGQRFVVAERQGDWTAIWWAGSEAWFHSPAGVRTTVPTTGLVVQPKPGVTSVPVYGRAYPEASAYPSDIPVQTVSALPYTIKPGQAYAYGGTTPTGYYYAKTIDDSLPDDHTYVAGQDKYLTIQIGHRIGFVKAADVDVVPVH